MVATSLRWGQRGSRLFLYAALLGALTKLCPVLSVGSGPKCGGLR